MKYYKWIVFGFFLAKHLFSCSVAAFWNDLSSQIRRNVGKVNNEINGALNKGIDWYNQEVEKAAHVAKIFVIPELTKISLPPNSPSEIGSETNNISTDSKSTDEPRNRNKVTFEVTRKSNGYLINDQIFISDSTMKWANRVLPGISSMLPGNPIPDVSSTTSSSKMVSTEINQFQNSNQKINTTPSSLSSETTPRYYMPVKEEKIALHLKKQPGGYLFNGTTFIEDKLLDIVRKFVPGLNDLLPSNEGNQGDEILLELRKTDNGVLINETVFLPNEQINLAREFVPWIGSLVDSESNPKTVQLTPEHIAQEQVDKDNSAAQHKTEPNFVLYKLLFIFACRILFG